MKANLITIGRWSLALGIILAVAAGFTEISNLPFMLFALGLVVGFLNVTEKEGTSFLVALITLLLIGVAGLQFGKLTSFVVSILNNFTAFVAAAGLVVALKQIFVVIKPGL